MESNSRNITRGILPLLAVHAVSEYYRLPWKPPVTAALVTANTLVYLRPSFLKPFVPSIHKVYFNPYIILKYRDLRRLFLSPFYHVNDAHLVYNMISLLWKGVQLETFMGSVEFASMVAALLAMSQTITLLLAKSFLLFFDYERPFYSEYAVGFSGVLFAMKVILNSHSENYTSVHGLVVPARYGAWAELILTHMFVPGVSFIGHLGGILAGILYLKFKGSYSGNGSLSMIIKGVISLARYPLRFVRYLFRSQRPRISGRGTVGGNQYGMSMSSVWRCRACTFDNSGWLNECEMCGTSRGSSGTSAGRGGNNSHHMEDNSLEELRRRRIERFERQ